MPNGNDHSSVGLVEQAQYYVNKVIRLEKELDKVKGENRKLSGEVGTLKKTIKLLKP